MAITDLWHPTRPRRHAQRPNKLRERLGPQLLAARRHHLPMLARSPSQSQPSSLSVSVTHYVQFRLTLVKKKELQKLKTRRKVLRNSRMSQVQVVSSAISINNENNTEKVLQTMEKKSQ